MASELGPESYELRIYYVAAGLPGASFRGSWHPKEGTGYGWSTDRDMIKEFNARNIEWVWSLSLKSCICMIFHGFLMRRMT